MKEMSFEEAVKKLDKTVKALEGGEFPLDKSLLLYEEGVKLTNYCQKLLKEAEAKISVLTKKENGEMAEIPFVQGEENE